MDIFLRKEKLGFTLLELIIVIIVVGILASLAIPRYIRLTEKGRVGEAKTILSSIRSAQIRYAAQYATYTNVIANLDINLPAAKYFSYAALGVSANLSDESVAVCQANRTNLDNPGVGNYMLNITMGGNISGDATGLSLL